MANLLINNQPTDNYLEEVQKLLSDDDSDNENDEEMRLLAGELRAYKPPILFQSFYDAPLEDQQILNEIHSTSQNNLVKYQKSKAIRSKVQKLLKDADCCNREAASEDDWSYFVVWPMLKLARKISKLNCKVKMIPMQSSEVCPKNLLPQSTQGTAVDKRIDFGLAVELDDDQINQINQTDQMDEVASYGVGASCTSLRLRFRPLFCTVEVKKPEHPDDPLVQLGVYNSAIYARWERIATLQVKAPPLRDCPVLFGWTIVGHSWLLHIIRRLPNGSRQFTTDSQAYNTLNPHDIYLLLATLGEVMNRGNSEFRTSFAANILRLPTSVLTSDPLSSTLSPARRSSSSSILSSASALASEFISALRSRVKEKLKIRTKRGWRVEK